MQEQRIYAAIDLKSFYASAECIERGLDPMTTNLVVADEPCKRGGAEGYGCHEDHGDGGAHLLF